jgi:hypothetical protein
MFVSLPSQRSQTGTALLTFVYGFEKNIAPPKERKEFNENWRDSTRL